MILKEIDTIREQAKAADFTFRYTSVEALEDKVKEKSGWVRKLISEALDVVSARVQEHNLEEIPGEYADDVAILRQGAEDFEKTTGMWQAARIAYDGMKGTANLQAMQEVVQQLMAVDEEMIELANRVYEPSLKIRGIQ